MPLQSKKNGDQRGTESDGSKSETWCQLCYKDGAFTRPNATLEEMKVIIDQALVANGSGRLLRWMAQKQLPHLSRWK